MSTHATMPNRALKQDNWCDAAALLAGIATERKIFIPDVPEAEHRTSALPSGTMDPRHRRSYIEYVSPPEKQLQRLT